MKIDDYMKLPYTMMAVYDAESGTWTGAVRELPGCLTQANTFEALEGMLKDAMHGWIRAALDMGQEIPKPSLKFWPK